MAPPRPVWSDESGSGVVSIPLSVLMFLLFLFFAVQVMLHLSIVSRANALAFDVASAVARGDLDCGTAPLENRVDAFGGQWDATVDSCSRGAEVTVVRISGQSPALIVEAVGSAAGLRTIVREVSVRTEDVRP